MHIQQRTVIGCKRRGRAEPCREERPLFCVGKSEIQWTIAGKGANFRGQSALQAVGERYDGVVRGKNGKGVATIRWMGGHLEMRRDERPMQR